MRTLNTVLVVLLGLLTLIILGAEPSGTSEEELSRYNDACDLYGLAILWGWLITAIFLIVTISLTPNQKEKDEN